MNQLDRLLSLVLFAIVALLVAASPAAAQQDAAKKLSADSGDPIYQGVVNDLLIDLKYYPWDGLDDDELTSELGALQIRYDAICGMSVEDAAAYADMYASWVLLQRDVAANVNRLCSSTNDFWDAFDLCWTDYGNRDYKSALGNVINARLAQASACASHLSAEESYGALSNLSVAMDALLSAYEE